MLNTNTSSPSYGMRVTPWGCGGTVENINRSALGGSARETHNVSQLCLGIVELFFEEFGLRWAVSKV